MLAYVIEVEDISNDQCTRQGIALDRDKALDHCVEVADVLGFTLDRWVLSLAGSVTIGGYIFRVIEEPIIL